MKKIIAGLLLLFGIGAAALMPSGPNWSELATDMEAAETTNKCEWTDLASGKFYIKPLNHWFSYVPPPIHHDQTHWYLEVSGVYETDDKINIDELRKLILKEYVKMKILPASLRSQIHPFPRDLYLEQEWERVVLSAIKHKYKTSVNFCKARVVIHSLRRSATPDQRWWDENIITFKQSFGECKPECGEKI
tara:strand:+ start:625 stop:1197 length:573 start_codon:yes stop_codon:yes gene_type:complete